MPGILGEAEKEVLETSSTSFFSGCDLFLAKRIFSDASLAEVRALAYLFAAFRSGRLYVNTEEIEFCPDLAPELKEGFVKLKAREDKRFCFVGKNLYLKQNLLLEEVVSSAFLRLNANPVSFFCDPLIYKDMVRGEEQKGMLTKDQAWALEAVADSRAIVIFGGPGSGKSHTAAVLVEILGRCVPSPDFKVVIAAPTGKAACQLVKKTKANVKAVTLHSLLGIAFGKAVKPEETCIDADILIVDEASMIDAELLKLLLLSLPIKTRLILMGDPNQLPPVEPGAVFHKLIALGLSFRLEGQKRLSPKLSALALEISNKEIEKAVATIKNDFEFTEISGTASFFRREIVSRFKDKYAYLRQNDILKMLKEEGNFRILSAMRQGGFGTESINAAFLFYFKSLELSTFAYPIIITKNDYSLGLFTGELGIKFVNKEKKETFFYFSEDDSTKKFEHVRFYEPAFALSVHKSQGSEFKEVAFILAEGSAIFGREMLYTAVTRAKEKLCIIGKSEVLKACLEKSFFYN